MKGNIKKERKEERTKERKDEREREREKERKKERHMVSHAWPEVLLHAHTEETKDNLVSDPSSFVHNLLERPYHTRRRDSTGKLLSMTAVHLHFLHNWNGSPSIDQLVKSKLKPETTSESYNTASSEQN